MQNVEVSRFPINVDALKKGDVLNQTEIESITRCRRAENETRYALKLLGLREYIMDVSLEENRPLICRIKNNSIEILTDEQAVEYTDDSCISAKRRYRRWLYGMQSIDSNNLSDALKSEWLRNIEIRGKGYQGLLLGEKGKLQIEPYHRKTPLLQLPK